MGGKKLATFLTKATALPSTKLPTSSLCPIRGGAGRALNYTITRKGYIIA